MYAAGHTHDLFICDERFRTHSSVHCGQYYGNSWLRVSSRQAWTLGQGLNKWSTCQAQSSIIPRNQIRFTHCTSDEFSRIIYMFRNFQRVEFNLPSPKFKVKTKIFWGVQSFCCSGAWPAAVSSKTPSAHFRIKLCLAQSALHPYYAAADVV